LLVYVGTNAIHPVTKPLLSLRPRNEVIRCPSSGQMVGAFVITATWWFHLGVDPCFGATEVWKFENPCQVAVSPGTNQVKHLTVDQALVSGDIL